MNPKALRMQFILLSDLNIVFYRVETCRRRPSFVENHQLRDFAPLIALNHSIDIPPVLRVLRFKSFYSLKGHRTSHQPLETRLDSTPLPVYDRTVGMAVIRSLISEARPLLKLCCPCHHTRTRGSMDATATSK